MRGPEPRYAIRIHKVVDDDWILSTRALDGRGGCGGARREGMEVLTRSPAGLDTEPGVTPGVSGTVVCGCGCDVRRFLSLLRNLHEVWMLNKGFGYASPCYWDVISRLECKVHRQCR